jgi:HPt (histidine-containing phosphotransfer) domain-containing protein
MPPRKAPNKLKVDTFDDHQIITQPNPLRTAVKRVAENDRDDPVARAEQALHDLSDQFGDWMSKECDRLAAAFDAVRKHGFNATAKGELFRAAHDIKGDAATFGYPIAAAAADSLCRILEHSPDIESVPAELIGHHVNAIHAIVREHNKMGVMSTAEELSKRLRGVADAYLTAVNRDRPEHLEVILAPSLAPSE